MEVCVFKSKEHFAAGLIVWFLICTWVHVPLWAVLVGSILPDCDIRYSWAGKVIPAWLFVKHRGVTHSVQFLGIVSLICACFCGVLGGLGLGIGYLLHLAMDSTTPMGIKWIYRRKKATP
jgi:membrane-bound metal-dependent hydrolase YbcI (DUF457 family)